MQVEDVVSSIVPGIGELGGVGCSAYTMTEFTNVIAIGITGPPKYSVAGVGMNSMTVEVSGMTFATFPLAISTGGNCCIANCTNKS
jgi:hypothetical protein